MPIHRTSTEPELGRNLLVGVAGRGQFQHLMLASAEQ